MLAKGVVYALIGVLTALAAFNLGGSNQGKGSVLQLISDLPLGNLLLGVFAFGLFGYVFFRFYQAFFGDEEPWSKTKGFIKRLAYIISGLFYGLLGVAALRIVFAIYSGDDTNMVQMILSKPYGKFLLIFIALCIAGKAFYQLYRAYSGSFREDVAQGDLGPKEQSTLVKAGVIGFTARGIVSGILTYLLFKISLSNQGQVEGQEAAFDFLQNKFGAIIMGITALGLVGYALYMFIRAKYTNLKM